MFGLGPFPLQVEASEARYAKQHTGNGVKNDSAPNLIQTRDPHLCEAES